MKRFHSFRGNSGFTLVELTIVMLILIALAGIMVPMLGGFTDRAHNSAAASNISELNKMLELFSAKTQKGYPDQFDNFTDGGTTGIWTGDATAVPVKVGISPAAALVLTPHALGTNEALSLTSAGITRLTDAAANTDNATFHVFDVSASATDMIAVAPAVKVASLPLTTLQTAGVGLQNADTTKFVYILLGLGQSSTAIGQVMAAAPVHYDTIDPAVFYQRYGCIFQVPLETTPNQGAPAKLVGVVGIHDGGLSGLDDHIGAYNRDVNTGN